MQITCIMRILFVFCLLLTFSVLFVHFFFVWFRCFIVFIFALPERSTNCRSSGRHADRWEGKARGFGTGINRTLFVYTLLSVQLKECVSFIFSLSLFLCLIFWCLAPCVFSKSKKTMRHVHVRHGTVWHFGTLKKQRAKRQKKKKKTENPRNQQLQSTQTQQVQLQESSWITIAEKKNKKRNQNRNRKMLAKKRKKKSKGKQTDRHKPGCSKYFVDACLFKSFANCTAAVKGALVSTPTHAARSVDAVVPSLPHTPPSTHSPYSPQLKSSVFLFFFFGLGQTDKRHKPHLPLAALFMQMTLVN